MKLSPNYTVLVRLPDGTSSPFGQFQTLREAQEFAATWRRADAKNCYTVVNPAGDTVG